MTASVNLLATLVSIALLVTLLAPVILVGLLIRDWKKRTLW
ncbi:MAG: hypothetical protein RQ736_09685 [Thiogranum sp.]|nr:hypothetical protein [Thiogranum sp.]